MWENQQPESLPALFFGVSEIHELCRLLEYRRTAAEEMLVAVFT